MKIYTTIMLSILSVSAIAGTVKPLKIGSGGAGGSYFPMINDAIDFCAANVSRKLENVEQKSGSVGNILDMVNKKLNGGITQIDVLKFYGKKVMPAKVNGSRMKVIIGLHREAGHLLIPNGWSPQASGFSFGNMLAGWGIGSVDKPQGINIDALKGQTVGAWGGSLISVKALSSFLKLGLKPVEIEPGALVDHPVLIVAGQPSKVVSEYLTNGYKLVPINAESLTSRADFYDAVTLSYAVNGNVSAVPSFGVRAVLIGKSSRTEARNKPMSELATCLRKNLGDLADDGDTNPNWESVFEFEKPVKRDQANIEDWNRSRIEWNHFPLLDTAQ